MTSSLERLLSLTFGKEGNESNYLGNGWSGDEPGGRWMVGQGSELWLDYPGPGHETARDDTLRNCIVAASLKFSVFVRGLVVPRYSVPL